MRVGKVYPKHNARARLARAISSNESLIDEIARLRDGISWAITDLQDRAPKTALDRLKKVLGTLLEVRS